MSFTGDIRSIGAAVTIANRVIAAGDGCEEIHDLALLYRESRYQKP